MKGRGILLKVEEYISRKVGTQGTFTTSGDTYKDLPTGKRTLRKL